MLLAHPEEHSIPTVRSAVNSDRETPETSEDVELHNTECRACDNHAGSNNEWQEFKRDPIAGLKVYWESFTGKDAKGKELLFYPIDSKPPWELSILMGLQHALAMAAGIVTIPVIISGADSFRLPTPDTQYLISVGLILSGLSSLIQVHRFELPFDYLLGTGMISIAGTSFTFVPIAQAAAKLIMQQDSTHPCTQDADCLHAWAGAGGTSLPGITNIGQCNTATNRCRKSGADALGAFLGTSMLCCFLELALAFLPPRLLSRMFPPAVTGVCVTLIGAGLTGVAFKYWGGGPACSSSATPHTALVHRGLDCHAAICGNGAAEGAGGAGGRFGMAQQYRSHSPCVLHRASAPTDPSASRVGVLVGESGAAGALTGVGEKEGAWESCGGFDGALKSSVAKAKVVSILRLLIGRKRCGGCICMCMYMYVHICICITYIHTCIHKSMHTTAYIHT